MPLHDGLHNCQAQAGSGGVFARLAPTKAQARTLDVRLRHTRPVVFDHDLCAGTFHPDPHGNDAARRRITHGIVDQINDGFPYLPFQSPNKYRLFRALQTKIKMLSARNRVRSEEHTSELQTLKRSSYT